MFYLLVQKKGEAVKLIFSKLYNEYGPQGWWPLINYSGLNTAKTGAIKEYHPLNYDLPKTRDEIYEIILGTILTQNTSWTSAKKALLNLNSLNAINPEKLLSLKDKTIKEAIRCAGFLNQKTKYIKAVTHFYISLEDIIPTRNELLNINGIGNETADSILLYAYKQPEFVVDTYTKRIFLYNGIINENDNYNRIKYLFESNLDPEFYIYNEYHALIVEHAKRYYSTKPYGEKDPLLQNINIGF
ncbi:MAG: endonuclease III domain-containing protein [Methanobacterium sp.]|nr:endonuclease III domain-containing protein [Methanobacterium sp.]